MIRSRDTKEVLIEDHEARKLTGFDGAQAIGRDSTSINTST